MNGSMLWELNKQELEKQLNCEILTVETKKDNGGYYHAFYNNNLPLNLDFKSMFIKRYKKLVDYRECVTDIELRLDNHKIIVIMNLVHSYALP